MSHLGRVLVYPRDMRPEGSATELEQRRRRAIKLLEDGQKPAAVAQQLGVTLRSVLRWKAQYERDGKEGLVRKSPPGHPKLATRQEQQIGEMLRSGDLQQGSQHFDKATPLNIANFFWKHFGVLFHPRYIPRFLTRLGGVYEPNVGWRYQQAGITPRPSKRLPGRPPNPRLSEKQIRQLVKQLEQRLRRLEEAWELRNRKFKAAYSSRTSIEQTWVADRRESWCTSTTLQGIILEELGVEYDVIYLRRLLKQFGWQWYTGFGWLPKGQTSRFR